MLSSVQFKPNDSTGLHYDVGMDINIQEWNQASYRPTPTIIEAAKALYQGHQVEDISRSDAGAINLK